MAQQNLPVHAVNDVKRLNVEFYTWIIHFKVPNFLVEQENFCEMLKSTILTMTTCQTTTAGYDIKAVVQKE